MKISKLQIEQYRHLENLDFDFTYPDDFHIEEKRGKPLDKICFIGQSASGKTSLLELITNQAEAVQNVIYNENGFSYSANVQNNVKGNINFNLTNKKITLSSNTLTVNDIQHKEYFGGGSFGNLLNDDEKTGIIYLQSNILSEKNTELFTKNPIELLEKFPNIINVDLEKQQNLLFGKVKNIGETFNSESWLFLISEILKYRKKFNQKMSELIHKGLLGNQKKLSAEFEKWQKENPNKLEEFAQKFNPILEKLNLEVDIIDTEYSIPIKNKRTDEIIPIQNTSTGTKGLLLTFLPLFKLDTKDSIILIDEPERSLYPDMQMDLMEYYQNLAPEAQFIIATHSPFIAASFEPEERFILSFDNEGKVVVRRGSSPIGDDPNDMLENDFGINYINKFGQKKHEEYLELKQQIFFEKNESKKKKIAEKLEKLGEEYNF